MSNASRLLSRMLDGPTNFIEAKKQGISKAAFISPEEQRVWEVIDGYFQKHSAVPTVEYLTSLVPTFVLMDAGGRNTSELCELTQQDLTELRIRTKMAEVDDALARRDFSDAISMMHKGASEAGRSFTLARDAKMSSHAQELVARYQQAKNGGFMFDIPWPWRPLQEATGGIEDGTFNVLYGRPKSTKTWRLLEIAAMAREHDKRVLLVSCEMQEKTLLNRIAAIECRLDYSKIRRGELDPDQEELFLGYLQMQEMMEYESDIVVTMLADDTDSRTVSALRAKIDQHEPDLILIDSAYKMVDEQTGRRDSKPETIRNVTNDLQHLAGASRIPMVVTSQANRAGEKAKQGTTADAAFSDSFGMDCDVMLRVTNDPQIERTVFFIQAAREVEIEGFSVKNRCADDMGPYIRSDGVEDWSIPAQYLEGGDSPPPQTHSVPTIKDGSRFT